MIARVLAELNDQRQVEFVVQALQGLKTEDASAAAVQVSQALASMDRPDIVVDVRTSVRLCTQACAAKRFSTHGGDIPLRRLLVWLAVSTDVRDRICCNSKA